MKKAIKSLGLYCIIGILICFGILHYGQVRVENAVLYRGNTSRQITLPLSQKMDDGEMFKVRFVISNPLNLPYDLNIVPDDCAESMVVNGVVLSLKDYHERCNFKKGFWIADSVTTPHRVGNETHYEISMTNGGGIAGINVFPKDNSTLLLFLKIMIALLAGLFLVPVAKHFGFGSFVVFCMFLGVLLRFAMFYALPYTQFSMDIDGHLAYIQYIIDNHSIPAAKDCWSCYHPPVYYASAVPSFLLGEWIGYASTSGAQIFSLVLSLILLVCGLIVLKEVVHGIPFGVASILWTVWPVLLLAAPRIGNDQLFYALHTLCLLTGFNYIKNGKGKNLVIAVVCAALAVWTKATGYISLGLVLLFTFVGFVKTNKLHRPSRTEIIGWALLLLVLAGLAVEKIVGSGDFVANIDTLHSRLRVGNEARNFLYFDLRTFLIEPYTDGWADGQGREYFFNYAFKTSLFGEWRLVDTAMGRTLASLMSLSLLGLIVLSIRGWWRTKMDVCHWILFIQGMAFFAALAYLRYRYPYACSNDFRYIMPALLSFLPYIGLGVYQEEYTLKWKALGMVIVAVFAVCSVMLMCCIV